MSNYFAELDEDSQNELRERLPEHLLERAATHVVNGIDLDTATDYDPEVERALEAFDEFDPDNCTGTQGSLNTWTDS